MSTRGEPQLQHAEIEVVVEADPPDVYCGIVTLAASLWGVDDSDIVTSSPPSLLVHSVRLDEEISCWLTWNITPADAGASLVRLAHDEPDLRSAPAPELGEVMAVLSSQLMRSATDLPRQWPGDGEVSRDA